MITVTTAAALALVEHRFRTGDRVDVMLQNHEPERTVVEIEIAGEANICTGIHRVIKCCRGTSRSRDRGNTLRARRDSNPQPSDP